jgi:hypothetical protein
MRSNFNRLIPLVLYVVLSPSPTMALMNAENTKMLITIAKSNVECFYSCGEQEKTLRLGE